MMSSEMYGEVQRSNKNKGIEKSYVMVHDSGEGGGRKGLNGEDTHFLSLIVLHFHISCFIFLSFSFFHFPYTYSPSLRLSQIF